MLNRCPDCGQYPQTFADADGWIIECAPCGREAKGATRKAATAAWNEATATMTHTCANCGHFEIGGAVDFCRLVRQKREPNDFCSRWKR